MRIIGRRPISSPANAAAEGILPDFLAYLSVYGAKKIVQFFTQSSMYSTIAAGIRPFRFDSRLRYGVAVAACVSNAVYIINIKSALALGVLLKELLCREDGVAVGSASSLFMLT